MTTRLSFSVRAATPADAPSISELIALLGFDAGAEMIGVRLAALGERDLCPLVAEADRVVGCVSLGIMHVLHRPAPVGRISMLVVAPPWRGKGVGRALVERALDGLRQAGCGLCEVTSNAALPDAHAFYERLGFQATSLRFVRSL